MFIPKHLKEWKPEHMRTTPMRRCTWCASGPHRLSELTQLLESPMRWYFCSEKCCTTWQLRRHDADVVAWLKLTTAERAEILTRV